MLQFLKGLLGRVQKSAQGNKRSPAPRKACLRLEELEERRVATVNLVGYDSFLTFTPNGNTTDYLKITSENFSTGKFYGSIIDYKQNVAESISGQLTDYGHGWNYMTFSSYDTHVDRKGPPVPDISFTGWVYDYWSATGGKTAGDYVEGTLDVYHAGWIVGWDRMNWSGS